MARRHCKFFQQCGNMAVYQIPYSRLNLCKDHFLKNVQKRVKNLIEKKHMFHPFRNEKLLVAASGGKDSQVLLHILKQIYPEGLDIHALYIDLGIKTDAYSPDSLESAKQLCKSLDIPFQVLSVKHEFNMSIDAIYELYRNYKDKNWINENNSFRGMCAYCGTFKRYNLNKYASEHQFTAVATGHNLTDEMTALTTNFLNSKLQFLANSGPVNDSNMDLLVPRVKPLFYISEDQVIIYAYLAQIPHNPTECPYAEHSPNSKVKVVMNKIEEQRKGNMISAMRRFQKVTRPLLKQKLVDQFSESDPDNLCNRCRRPTFAKTCAFCRMLDSLNGRFDRLKAEKNLDLR